MTELLKIPDVVGFNLKKARSVLLMEGIIIESVKVTAPPREAGQEAEDYFRVLKLNHVDRLKVELIVCKPL